MSIVSVALYPEIRRQMKPNCGETKLEFFKSTYTRQKCTEEFKYKSIMDKCFCRPPYFPAYKNYPDCTVWQHLCISEELNNYSPKVNEKCPNECENHRYSSD